MIILLHSAGAAKSTIAARIILEALGVRSLREISIEEFSKQSSQSLEGFSTNKFNASTLIAPFSCIESISSFDPASGSLVLRLPETIKRVFFHSLDSPHNCERVLQALLGDSAFRFVQINSRHADFAFSDDERDICGPLTGLSIQLYEDMACWGLVLQSRPSDNVRPLITSDSASVLLRLRKNDLDIFMLFTSHLGDPNQPLKGNLDIRTCLFSFAAPVMVLKYLSRGIGWSARNNYANLIIDDPPLLLRYGNIDFRRIHSLATKRDIAITLAYIPINYRRGNDESIAFFKKASDCIAICIHGCNHTGSEFGDTDSGRLSALTSLGSNRMNSFSERTGLSHAKIMVFPQGVFSSQALGVLKRYNFNAAVNTGLEHACGDKCIRIKDMLEPAVSYDGFPLFLRRNISDWIGNFAFDLLLDKPCLIVAHHGDFFSDISPIWQLIDAINSLPDPPEWRPLGDIVARTALSRTIGNNMIELKMYSRVADLKHITGVPSENCLRVIKDESHPEAIKRILVGQRETEWHVEKEKIVVDVGKHFEGLELKVLYRQDQLFASCHLRLSEVIWAYYRRWLCEFRDNCVSKFPALQGAVHFVKKILIAAESRK